MSQKRYIHGYSEKEKQRLLDQGSFLEEMIYEDIDFEDCNHILEVGCGVGAHLKILLNRYPDIKVTGVDIDGSQLEQANQNLIDAGHEGRFELIEADATTLTLDENNLPDGAILCWVLEHTGNAADILKAVHSQLQTRSPIYITEVFNIGFYTQPTFPNLTSYWQAYNTLQLLSGGDIVAGVKLGSNLDAAGFHTIKVKQICQLHDSRNKIRREIMAKYLYDLLISSCEQLLENNLVTAEIISGLKPEFEQLIELDESIIFYPGFQAFALS